jgi:hypothetical protein
MIIVGQPCRHRVSLRRQRKLYKALRTGSNVLAQPRISLEIAIEHSRKGNGLVLEHIVRCFVEQLSRQQRDTGPTRFELLAFPRSFAMY